ncbi:MAG: pentapeptide repeat-containing protein, partial [Clostridiales bacterium]|nr:pentapeptide repeat-containing protein [Clostridiales bacterium]
MSFQSLRIECGKCFGLCCTVLCFSATDGFPVDKKTGVPCPELRHDFSCNIHEALSRKGFKGCLGYDCFGAGQKVSQITFHGKDWRSFPDISGAMFEVFPFMQQLHEMLWYIEEALALPISVGLHEKLKQKKIQT